MSMSSSRLDLIFGIAIMLLVFAIWVNHRRSGTAKITASAELDVQTLIEKVRNGLVNAEQERLAKQGNAVLELKEVDLEINFVVEESYKGSGAVDLKVTTVGGESNSSSQATQKIRLHLVAAKPEAGEDSASSVPLVVDQSTILRGEKPEQEK